MNLRPMEMSDADFMLEMKNDPQTRKFAIVANEEIKKEDHYSWLIININDFRVIEKYTGERLGAIRVKEGEVSIWVAKEFRGQMIATKVLARHEFFDTWCKIVDGNVASLRSFVKAGYLPTGHIDNYYILRR